MIKFNLNSFEIVSCSYYEAIKLFMELLDSGKKTIISHFNLYNFYILSKENYSKYKSKNTILFFEGIFLKIFMFLKIKKILPDVNGTDLSKYVFDELRKTGKKIFLLGAEQEISESVRNRLAGEESLSIAGFHNGYFNFEEESVIIDKINSSGAEVLINAMGFSKEMNFAIANYGRLNVKIIWNVGGLFDFLSGHRKRAPEIMRVLGLEWLFRLIQEPEKKLFRNLYPPVWFVIMVIKSYIKKKVNGY
jgi:N-acetylglucosaminyldiphosphoundecaprenol N-acetyl-beta-D-mannosaminyltransferase